LHYISNKPLGNINRARSPSDVLFFIMSILGLIGDLRGAIIVFPCFAAVSE